MNLHDAARAFRTAQNKYQTTFREYFDKGILASATERLWEIQHVLVREVIRFRFGYHRTNGVEQAARELFRKPLASDFGGLDAEPVGCYRMDEAIQFAKCWSEMRRELHEPLFDVVEDRGDDAYGDLLDALPLASRDVIEKTLTREFAGHSVRAGRPRGVQGLHADGGADPARRKQRRYGTGRCGQGQLCDCAGPARWRLIGCSPRCLAIAPAPRRSRFEVQVGFEFAQAPRISRAENEPFLPERCCGCCVRKRGDLCNLCTADSLPKTHAQCANNNEQKAKVYAEDVKNRHTTHWDLDYMSTEEIEKAYRHEPGRTPTHRQDGR